jgi:hypothetical protein
MNHKPPQPRWSASLLRRDLNARAQHLATTTDLLHDQTPGNSPSILFGRDEQARHGNFHPASYAAICANPAWSRRLTKVHTAHRKLRARADWPWMELDCANSSDALLMNIFCHPGVFNGDIFAPAIARLFNIDPAAQPHFGINPGVPLNTTRKNLKAPKELTDRTEIDLQLNDLFLEAKLTESSFQTAPLRLIERYRDLDAVFDLTRLPRTSRIAPNPHPPVEDFSQSDDTPPPQPAISTSHPASNLIQNYQLIRNVLAAYAANASFCVLCDARRTDLIESWYQILSTVHRPTFACRLKLLTWQEIAGTLPNDLQRFLDIKYGITPA